MSTPNPKTKCPIPGCNFHYHRSIVGWPKHVGVAANHPYWAKEGQTQDELQLKFRDAYPKFFANAQESRYSERPHRTKSGEVALNMPRQISRERIEQLRALLAEYDQLNGIGPKATGTGGET